MAIILLVDDELQNLNALKRELSERSPEWTIYVASSETEATAHLNQFQVDVVVTDLVMVTAQGGMDVIRHAKAKDPLVMVILITAFEKRLERYRAFELGAFDCIQKNMPGVVAVDEIFIKTKAALQFRDLALQQIKSQQRLSFLGRYFDPGVFGILEQAPELLDLRNDTLTICFWDIRGFSTLCEGLKARPDLIAGFLKEYFGLAAKVIFEHRGVLDKFIGDGVMGLFGALTHKNDEGRQDAIDAVGAAVKLQRHLVDALSKWTREWTLFCPQTINLGLACGIHTGEVLVGNVGTEIRDQFTALGPSVNFAQRIEGRASGNQILLSASTQIRVKDSFDLEEVRTIDDVKNIPGQFRLFRVIRD